MNIILLGAPGVGKGTYAELLSKKYALPHISTGDLLRTEVRQETEVGKKAKPYMDKGLLVPDDAVIELLTGKLKEPSARNGFFLDGFPRTLEQAGKLEKIVKIHKVLSFEASLDIILGRIGGRRICRKCGAIFHIKNMPPKKAGICDKCGGNLYQRDDEQPAIIKVRLETYKKQTEPLIEYYSGKGLLMRIDANPAIDKINDVIRPCIEELDRLR